MIEVLVLDSYRIALYYRCSQLGLPSATNEEQDSKSNRGTLYGRSICMQNNLDPPRQEATINQRNGDKKYCISKPANDITAFQINSLFATT